MKNTNDAAVSFQHRQARHARCTQHCSLRCRPYRPLTLTNSALAAARKNDLQKSINLALGSSLATIGLTVPAVAIATYILEKRLVLGLETRDSMMLIMTFLVSLATFGTGRTNIMFGMVHLVMFAVFMFLVLVP